MRKRFAIFRQGNYANHDGYRDTAGLPKYMFNPFIQEASTFATEKEAIKEACRIELTTFSILPVYFR